MRTREDMLHQTIEALMKILSSQEADTNQKLTAAGLLLKACRTRLEGDGQSSGS